MLMSAIVLDGRYKVYENGTIFKLDGSNEVPAKTVRVGRSGSATKYVGVSYKDGGKQKIAYVHRLIATAFLPNPDGKKEVTHIDGNRENNDLSNLKWCTRRESCVKAYESGAIDPFRNGVPCAFCGAITRSKSGCCRDCLPKFKIVENRMLIQSKLREKYLPFDTSGLTDRESRCVTLAKSGMRKSDIARKIGVSRQRVDQILDRAEEKQRGVRSINNSEKEHRSEVILLQDYEARIRGYNREKQTALMGCDTEEQVNNVIKYLRKKWRV